MPNSRAFAGQRLDLLAALGIGDAVAAVGRLDVVVDDGERLLRRAHSAAGQPQALEGLRARHLVDEVAVDVDEARAARRLDDMVVPDLVIQRTRHGHNVSGAGVGANEWGWRAIYAERGQDGRACPPLPL